MQPDGVRVTDMERTVLDNIDTFEKTMISSLHTGRRSLS